MENLPWTEFGSLGIMAGALVYVVKAVNSQSSELRKAEQAQTVAVVDSLKEIAIVLKGAADTMHANAVTTHLVIQEARELFREVQDRREETTR